VGMGAAGELLAGAEAEGAAVGVGEWVHDAEVYARGGYTLASSDGLRPAG
jgi:hypothetical protein